MTRILLDADSLPVRLREIIVRQADRRRFVAHFYANQKIPLPDSPGVKAHLVPDADDAMVADAAGGDIAVTHDIPLAKRLVDLDVTVLDERGGRFTKENIGERLAARNLAADLREADLLRNSGRPFGPREVNLFANALDRELTSRETNA